MKDAEVVINCYGPGAETMNEQLSLLAEDGHIFVRAKDLPDWRDHLPLTKDQIIDCLIPNPDFFIQITV